MTATVVKVKHAWCRYGRRGRTLRFCVEMEESELPISTNMLASARLSPDSPSTGDDDNNASASSSYSSSDEKNERTSKRKGARKVRAPLQPIERNGPSGVSKLSNVKQQAGSNLNQTESEYEVTPSTSATGISAATSEIQGGSESDSCNSDVLSESDEDTDEEADLSHMNTATGHSSHPTGQAKTRFAADLLRDTKQAAPQLRGIRKLDRPAKAVAPLAERKVSNVAGSFNNPMALYIRLRKRPFVLTTRPTPTGQGQRAPACSQRRQFVTFKKRHTVRDLKFDQDGKILLTTRRSVQRYDINGHYIEQLYDGKLSEPFGICPASNGNILVADCKENIVREFNPQSNEVRKYGPVSAPRGLTQSATGFVLVCAGEGTGVGSRCIVVFDKHANLHALLGEGKLRLPTYIALSDNIVVVSDHSRIIGFETSGRRAFVYGSGAWNDFPSCLSSDPDGFVLTTEYGQSIVCAMRKDLDRAVVILNEMQAIRRPVVVARSRFGYLVVGEKHTRGYVMKVFKLND